MNPKKRHDDKLLVEELGDETIVYDLDADRGHLLNRVAALVLEHSDGGRSVEELASIVHRETGLPADERIVNLALGELEDAGLVKAEVPATGPTRREVIRGLGLGVQAALLLGFVRSVAAPPAAYAQSPAGTTGPAPTTTEAPPKESTVAPF